MLNTLPQHWETLAPNTFEREFTFDKSWQGKTCLLPPTASARITVQAGVSVTLLEIYEAPVVREVQLNLQNGSHVQHVRLQVQPGDTDHQSHLAVSQAQNSRLFAIAMSAGARKALMNTEIVQAGSGAEAVIEGLYLVQAQQDVTMNASVNHLVPHGQSRQLFKGILAEHAQARFRGRIRIAPDAQHVDSRQLSSALILGKQATVETLPELEIYADDVKAAHGATVGQLDPEEIFYLQSRGLSRTEAVRLLAHGFMAEIIFHILDLPTQKFVLDQLGPHLLQLEERFVNGVRPT